MPDIMDLSSPKKSRPTLAWDGGGKLASNGIKYD